MKIGILVCSNACMDYIGVNDNTKIMRCLLNIENKEYRDYIDISAHDFYQTITDNKKIKISTAQPSTGIILDFLEEFKNEGYTDVIAITISSKLSGTFSGVNLAGQMAEGINLHTFDSKSLSYSEAYLAIIASEMAYQMKTPTEIIKKLEDIRSKSKILFCVDTLHYLVLNGRLSAVSGMLGSLLSIKPLLRINDDGSLLTLEKIRTKSKAVKRMQEVILEEIEGKEIILFAPFTNNEDEALESLNYIIKNTTAKIVNQITCPLTPVVGCHAGPKTFGIGYIILD